MFKDEGVSVYNSRTFPTYHGLRQKELVLVTSCVENVSAHCGVSASITHLNKRQPFLQNSSRDDSENEHPVKKFRSYLCQSAGTEESMEHTGTSDGEQMSNYI